MASGGEVGLIGAHLFDGKGGAKTLDWDGVRGWTQVQGVLWVHLDYRQEDSVSWLREQSGLDEVTVEALIADEPRPRALTIDKGLLLILRGINLNEGAQPEDMVSMRIWIDSQRVITLRHRRNNAAKEVRRRLGEGRGPKRVGDFVVSIIDCTLDPIGAVTAALEDDVAKLEEQVLVSDDYALRHQLADARRRAIALERHIAPERDVLSKLEALRLGWITEIDRAQLREEANRMTRILEDLDSVRDRAAVTQEELSARLSELTNKRLYVLSIITAIFLPLGLVTGLLGVNVGGMQLAGNPNGFAIIVATMALILVFQLLVFRWMRWL